MFENVGETEAVQAVVLEGRLVRINDSRACQTGPCGFDCLRRDIDAMDFTALGNEASFGWGTAAADRADDLSVRGHHTVNIASKFIQIHVAFGQSSPLPTLPSSSPRPASATIH